MNLHSLYKKTHTHARTHAHTPKRARARTHTHPPTHARTHTHTHTHTDTHTHTQSNLHIRVEIKRSTQYPLKFHFRVPHGKTGCKTNQHHGTEPRTQTILPLVKNVLHLVCMSFKSKVSAAVRVLFNLNTRCGTFKCKECALNRTELHLCPLKVNI